MKGIGTKRVVVMIKNRRKNISIVLETIGELNEVF